MSSFVVRLGIPAAALAVLVAGCGGGSSSSNGAAGKTGTAQKMTISVVDYMGDVAVNSTFNKLLAYCHQQQPNITFKRNVVPQADLITRVLQLAAAKKPADIVVADNPNIAQLADSGVLQSVDDLVGGSGIDLNNFYPGPLQAAKWKGKLYGVPIGSNGEALVYNKTLLRRAGISKVPTSWQELTDAARKLTKGGVYGFAVGTPNNELATWNYEPALWSDGGDLDKLDSPQAIEALDWWGSFARDGLSPKSELNWADGDVEARFARGSIAIAQIGSWEIPQLVKDGKKNGLDWGVAPQVSKTGDAPETPFGGEVIAVGAGAQGAKRAAVWNCLSSVQKPEVLLAFDEGFGYVPSWKPAVAPFLAQNPRFKPYAKQLETARSRTEKVGPRYDAVSKALSTAVQQVMSGQKSAADALHAAQEAASS